MSGALYWLVGVTDFYASLMLTRSGVRDEKALWDDLCDNYSNVISNPARLEVSPYESSQRVGEANDGLGNGEGWKISYYNLGWLAGFCLDMDLRERTHGKRTLDDVERALWSICRKGPGFEEGEIERQYVRLGGSKEVFERVVMKPGELPISENLAKLGLAISAIQHTHVDHDFGTSANINRPNIAAADVTRNALAAGLKDGDMILEVNGKPVIGKTMRQSLDLLDACLHDLKAGDPIKIKVTRDGAPMEFTFEAENLTTTSYSLSKLPNADSGASARLAAWESGRQPK
jgi:predicted metalloprotease with PDZ domain